MWPLLVCDIQGVLGEVSKGLGRFECRKELRTEPGRSLFTVSRLRPRFVLQFTVFSYFFRCDPVHKVVMANEGKQVVVS